ncbi:hypothetical protein [Paenibacillus assamensis]|uniref:hypothetical protein n=1 Tax=Paenibacillus assamensis TaxID=311244 RepID=UPI0003FFA4E9|nr:hypothetical protein [Paenibacillus assamensis]
MIYLEIHQVQRLMKLGFKPPYDLGEVYASRIYYYNDDAWAVGGRITGEDLILAPEEVYKEGIRLYSIDEVLDWVHMEGLGLRLDKNINSGYKFTIIDEFGIEHKGSGGTLNYAVFNTVERYLVKRNKKV